ncbi:MAG: hypothetical protein JWP96_1947 [Polaromonas sp.]|nr:hypothetical protein [Polaromonas sp.]
MNKSLIALLLALLAFPGPAFTEGRTYFGKTTVHNGSLAIAVQSYRHEVAAVALENRSAQAARCSVTFSNGAQFSETRQASVNPGKRVTVAYRVHVITSRVDIDVQCAPRKLG